MRQELFNRDYRVIEDLITNGGRPPIEKLKTLNNNMYMACKFDIGVSDGTLATQVAIVSNENDIQQILDSEGEGRYLNVEWFVAAKKDGVQQNTLRRPERVTPRW